MSEEVSYELVAGPQDGAEIRTVDGAIPQTIYVGEKWLGDKYSAWGKRKSGRFPYRYILDGFKYKYEPKNTNNW